MHIHTCFEFNHNHPDLHRHILGSLATRDILSGRIDKTLSLGKTGSTVKNMFLRGWENHG